jgi:predicted RND superfamily exporter protein
MSDTPAKFEHRSERLIYRYAHWAASRPVAFLAVAIPLIALAGWFGSGIRIRSNIEDLFPENTAVVLAAKEARETLKSSSQLTVVFGSPDREKNRALASAFCDRAAKWPEVAAVQCRRDIDFFRRNAALFLSIKELEDIDQQARDAIKRATEKGLVGDELMAGLDEDEPAAVPATPTPTAVAATPGGTATADPGEATAPAKPGKLRVPTDEDLRQRFRADDIREWNESPDGTVLGIKLFPTVSPSQLDESAKFVGKVNDLLADLQPKTFHPDMTIDMTGDYAEMTAEISEIKNSLTLTSVIALFVVGLIQVLHFRRFRALILMSLPLLATTALTLAFARVAIGYLNMITAFIFALLFGMGNDFNMYALSRYQEERSTGAGPKESAAVMTASLFRALNQAALTTSVAFFALVVLDFRGFSQFGLLAGVGVEIALVATLTLFPPMIMALDRVWPDRTVSAAQAEGLRWLGWFANRTVARVTIFAGTVLFILSAWAATDISFETNLRKLRTPPAAQDSSNALAKAKLSYRFRSEAEARSDSPVLVVTDSVDDARAIHDQLEKNHDKLTRIRHFVSIHTFVPAAQEEKIAIVNRIRDRLNAKMDSLEGDDRKEAERALTFLSPTLFHAEDLPDFVKNRFLDKENQLGRFVLMYANGNLAEASSVQQVIDQVGSFSVRHYDKSKPGVTAVEAGINGMGLVQLDEVRQYASTGSFFILAEADRIVRKEGPIAVLLAAIATLLVVWWHFRSLRLTLYAFIPLTVAFVMYLGAARAMGLTLNLFSVTALPGVLGIGIDGTTHILHRFWEEGKKADLRAILQQVGGAAWGALLTTMVGFAALLFQPNPGLQGIAWWALLGLPVVVLVSVVLAGSVLVLWPPKIKEHSAEPHK